MQILFWNRPNALTQPGGDTVVMLRTADALRARGFSVEIDLTQSQDPKNYNLVHLFNFALPQWLRAAAERCVERSVPYVVTTLCEDVEKFHSQSHVFAQMLINYVQNGQSSQWLRSAMLRQGEARPSASFDNRWVVEHAAALLANGDGEKAVLERLYDRPSNIEIVPVGFDAQKESTPDLFRQKYGLEDFVLCVGRIETRKNQLALLKALEDSELPVVLMGGGFSYQKDYAECVKAFKRAGKTLVLGRESDEMLASAYAASKVHVLPSWYELPGLVSLEAAYHGAQVVTTATGTTADYLIDKAWYCQPNDFYSIESAVHAAFYSEEKKDVKNQVQQFASWSQTAESTIKVYSQIVGEDMEQKTVVSISKNEMGGVQVSGLLLEAEQSASVKDTDKALSLFQQVLQQDPYCSRALRGKAAVLFSLNSVQEAKGLFQEAYSIDPSDARTLCGLGMCADANGHSEIAFAFFERALAIDPLQSVALLQFMECCYRLERFEQLESVLRSYIEAKPDDLDMQFALAGCLYRQGEEQESGKLCDEILSKKPSHSGAQELLQILKEKSQNDTKSTNEVQNTQPVQQEAAFDATDLHLAEMLELKRKRKYKEAVEHLDKLVSDMSGFRADQIEVATLLRAEIMTLVGRVAEAEDVFVSALQKNARNARALCGIGAIVASRGQWEQARAYFEKALMYDVRSDVACAGKALCASFTGSPELAWDYFRQALALNPENTRALLGVVELGQKPERYEVVEMHLREYLDHHPGDLNFLYALAGCLFSQSRFEEAENELSKMQLLDPGNERAEELGRFIEEKRTSGRIDISEVDCNIANAS